jgi:uncharacterized Zn finger protein
MGWWSYEYRPYVSVAQRRANAAREVQKLKKDGQAVDPVVIDGNRIAKTFWGKAWCDNLESYSDFANRLPRGRSYVKNGTVCDLRVEPGRVKALVCGTEVYRIDIRIDPVPAAAWKAIKNECAGQIGSLIELLQGKLSKAVMGVVTRRDDGLFPEPREIHMDCSCPDWADMCKHVAAALYGVGARLDRQPELLFALRQVDHLELVAEAPAVNAPGGRVPRARRIAAGDLADVFGVELEPTAPAKPASGNSKPAPASPRTPKARHTKSAARHGRGPDRPAKRGGRKTPARRSAKHDGE